MTIESRLIALAQAIGTDVKTLAASQGALTALNCSGNRLCSLTVGRLPALEALNCSFNDLASLDLSGCPVLDELDCRGNPLLESSPVLRRSPHQLRRD